MVRYFHIGILALVVSSLMSISALSAEVTMRMRDSNQTFSGKLVSFDGTVYVLETTLFGEMNFDISRFECVSGPCLPPEKMDPSPAHRQMMHRQLV